MASQPNPVPALKQAEKFQFKPGPKQRFPSPFTFAQVDKAGPEEEVIVWRGASWEALERMATAGSVGGEKRDENTKAPTPEEAAAQVGKGGDSRLPELTCKKDVAESFSKGGALVVLQVKKKYLTEGSGSEEGWVAYRSAPYTALMWTPGKPGKRLSVDAT